MYSLFLHPVGERDDSVNSTDVVELLSELTLIDRAPGQDCFVPGAKLLDYITFLGCSPTLRSGELECQLRIHRFDTKTWLGGQSIETLHFPKCRHVIDEPGLLLTGAGAKSGWLCPECGNSGQLDQINWRRCAGLANLFIEISSVFPKEALPSDKLLMQLQRLGPTQWAWFYSKSTD